MGGEQLEKVRNGQGLHRRARPERRQHARRRSPLRVEEAPYSSDDEMFDLIHEMRTRIITSPAFNGDRILGAILFEQTMDRQIEGRGTAEYLWTSSTSCRS